MPIEYKNISSDYRISRIIKGGWHLAGGHGPIDRTQAIQDMFTWVTAGLITFDCADIYTGVEDMIGDFRVAYQKKYGASELAKIKVQTKFVPDADKLSTIDKKYVTDIIDRSLVRLKIDCLDMVQFHWWDFTVPKYIEVAGYLQELQQAGKINLLGVTNFDTAHLQELLANNITIASNQIQYSLLDSRPTHGMIKFAQEHNIALLCYGTMAGGFLSEKYLGVPEPNEPFANRSLTKYKLIINEFGNWHTFQELLKTLQIIATNHQTSIANVAIKYILDQPMVAAAIVGATNTSHLSETVGVFDIKLTTDDMTKIKFAISTTQGPQGDIYSVERIKDGSHAKIMKYNLNKKI